MRTTDWVHDKRAFALPTEFSTRFEQFLNGLPWLGSALDWSKMPSAQVINLASADANDLHIWLSKTRIGAHSHIAIWYSAERGGLVVPLEIGVTNLDELYREAPGVRFAFGVDLREGQLEPAYGALLQYGSGDDLIAVGIEMNRSQ